MYVFPWARYVFVFASKMEGRRDERWHGVWRGAGGKDGQKIYGSREKRASLVAMWRVVFPSRHFTHRVSRNWADTSHRTNETTERASERARTGGGAEKGEKEEERSKGEIVHSTRRIIPISGVLRCRSYAVSGDRFCAACLFGHGTSASHCFV